jgi:hypothetical protein
MYVFYSTTSMYDPEEKLLNLNHKMRGFLRFMRDSERLNIFFNKLFINPDQGNSLTFLYYIIIVIWFLILFGEISIKNE